VLKKPLFKRSDSAPHSSITCKKIKGCDGILIMGYKRVRQKKINKEDSTPLPSLYKNIL